MLRQFLVRWDSSCKVFSSFMQNSKYNKRARRGCQSDPLQCLSQSFWENSNKVYIYKFIWQIFGGSYLFIDRISIVHSESSGNWFLDFKIFSRYPGSVQSKNPRTRYFWDNSGFLWNCSLIGLSLCFLKDLCLNLLM